MNEIQSDSQKSQSATARAYDHVKTAVMMGEYQAGDRIKEELIAEKIGVSRTPIRQALHKLTAEGFLTMPPNQGARVIEWSQQDTQEITDLRAILESFGAGIAARKITQSDLSRLETLAEMMEAAAATGRERELELITKYNSEFHMVIINSSGNIRLAEVIASLAHPLLIQRRFSGFDHARLRRSMAHHREIIDALRSGDSSWASSIMKSHILASRVAESDTTPAI